MVVDCRPGTADLGGQRCGTRSVAEIVNRPTVEGAMTQVHMVGDGIAERGVRLQQNVSRRNGFFFFNSLVFLSLLT